MDGTEARREVQGAIDEMGKGGGVANGDGDGDGSVDATRLVLVRGALYMKFWTGLFGGIDNERLEETDFSLSAKA
jgi:hypothetical protein